jgi:endonuclease/exonuclease/phosphatase family metal-dependent hydrolase
MVGEPDPVNGRHTVWNEPVDAFEMSPLPAGAATWVDDRRPELNKVIDYAFVHAALAPRLGKVGIDATAKGSDHLPLWVELD